MKKLITIITIALVTITCAFSQVSWKTYDVYNGKTTINEEKVRVVITEVVLRLPDSEWMYQDTFDYMQLRMLEGLREGTTNITGFSMFSEYIDVLEEYEDYITLPMKLDVNFNASGTFFRTILIQVADKKKVTRVAVNQYFYKNQLTRDGYYVMEGLQ